MWLEAFRFAAKTLTGQRRRTLLALSGVAIGVAAVVVLTALGEGARLYVVRQFAELGSNLIIVLPGKTETTGFAPFAGSAPNDLTLADTEVLQRSVPGATRIAPFSIGNETVSNGDRDRQVLVIGSTSDLLEVRDLHLASGSFLPIGPMDRGSSVVVLGATIASELFPAESPLGRIVRIGDWRMRVIGVLAQRGMQMGVDMNEVAIVPVATCMRMFNRTSLFRILVKLETHDGIVTARDRILAVLKERHDGEEDVTVWTQDSVIGSLSSILDVLTLALAGIAAISLAVAGIGIMNVMLVSVSERRAEIGLMRALGARARQVLVVFLAEAVLISSIGGAIGLLAGWLGVLAIVQFLPTFPASPPRWAIVAAIVVSVGTGAVFGFIPARRATKLDPIEALAKRA
jgi:putative ABC transport system permease protein